MKSKNLNDLMHTLGVHLFRCRWDDKWYGSKQEFIFAMNQQHAQDIVNDKFNYQNNIYNLTIREIPIREITRLSRQECVLVRETSSKPGKSQYYIDITRYYCSECYEQVMPGGDFCPCCGGYFRKEIK